MSVNKMYYIKPKGNRKVLTIKARELRARIMEDTIKQIGHRANQIVEEDEPQRIEITFMGDWLTLEGEVRKTDIDNRLKFLIDSIYNAIGFDDKYIYEIKAKKHQSNETACFVIIKNA